MYCHICHDSDYLIHQPAYINAFRWPIHIIGFRDAKSARLVYDGLPTTSESSATETAFGNFSEPILTSTLNLTLTTGKRSHASHEPSYKIPSLLHTVIKLRGSVFFRHADTVFWFFFKNHARQILELFYKRSITFRNYPGHPTYRYSHRTHHPNFCNCQTRKHVYSFALLRNLKPGRNQVANYIIHT